MVEKIVTSFEMKFQIRFVETKGRCSQFAERKVETGTIFGRVVGHDYLFRFLF